MGRARLPPRCRPGCPQPCGIRCGRPSPAGRWGRGRSCSRCPCAPPRRQVPHRARVWASADPGQGVAQRPGHARARALGGAARSCGPGRRGPPRSRARPAGTRGRARPATRRASSQSRSASARSASTSASRRLYDPPAPPRPAPGSPSFHDPRRRPGRRTWELTCRAAASSVASSRTPLRSGTHASAVRRHPEPPPVARPHQRVLRAPWRPPPREARPGPRHRRRASADSARRSAPNSREAGRPAGRPLQPRPAPRPPAATAGVPEHGPRRRGVVRRPELGPAPNGPASCGGIDGSIRGIAGHQRRARPGQRRLRADPRRLG